MTRINESLSRYFRKHQNFFGLVLPLALAISGITMLLIFVTSQTEAPKLTGMRQISMSSNPETLSTPFSHSKPVSVSVPSLDIESKLLNLGKNSDGTLKVPSAENYDKAAWYKHSPTPGQAGASILEGHVDYTDRGPGVFFELANIQPRAVIRVKRQDGNTAIFEVYKVATYKKSEFPTEEVYYSGNKAELRLITCGGNLNEQLGEYDSNTIAFARLVNPPEKKVKKSIADLMNSNTAFMSDPSKLKN